MALLPRPAWLFRPWVYCAAMAAESVVLEEEIDQNYEPTQDEIVEYATWLGMVSGGLGVGRVISA